jgi:hypothetical protein
VVFQFISGLTFNQDSNFETRINRAAEEITRVVTGETKHKLSNQFNISYEELKRVVEKILNNKDLMAASPLQFMYMQMMMPQL